jgi:hypothetical protein
MSTNRCSFISRKDCFPTPIIDFLGITLDTQKFEASFPPEKIEKCRSYLHRFLSRDRCTLKDMQSLVGTLNLACTVVQPGRAFLRRMINLTCTVAEHQKFISISEEAKLDMKIWLSFLKNSNDTSMFLHDRFLSNKTFYTDATKSKGFGGVYGSRWFYGSFPDDWKVMNIMTLEFYPIILALEIWGSLWKNHCILFFTDNEALVSVINKERL